MRRVILGALGVVFATIALACAGGGGALNDDMAAWESAPGWLESSQNSREGAPQFTERAPSSREGSSTTLEPGPGAQGVGAPGSSGGFDCSGTYSCIEAGDDDVDTVVLVSVNGVCTIPAGGGRSIVLASDGTLQLGGQTVGTWQATSGGFSANTEDGVVTCTKGGSASSSSGSSSSPDTPPPPSSGSSGGTTVVIDAGVQQPAPLDAGG